MSHEKIQATVLYDGACPLCQSEIAHYRRVDRDQVLHFVDVSGACPMVPAGVTQSQALTRFHVVASDGRILSGAAAFVAVWSHLPRWRWAARLARIPGATGVLELGYRAFLPLRPLLSRSWAMVQTLQRHRSGS